MDLSIAEPWATRYGEGKSHIQVPVGYDLTLSIDFDHAISMAHAMPYFGYGGELRRTFGGGLLPVPKAIYHDLAWR